MDQTLLVRTRRAIAVRSLTTVKRSDVAETVHNYLMEKAGFRLVLAPQDSRPLSLEDMAIAADGTTSGRTWLDSCPEK